MFVKFIFTSLLLVAQLLPPPAPALLMTYLSVRLCNIMHGSLGSLWSSSFSNVCVTTVQMLLNMKIRFVVKSQIKSDDIYTDLFYRNDSQGPKVKYVAITNNLFLESENVFKINYLQH